MDLHGKSVNIADHPLGKIVKAAWDRELPKRGYPKDINVCELSDKELIEIYTIIDAEVERWFEGQDDGTQRNHRNAWNYQARHKTKD